MGGEHTASTWYYDYHLHNLSLSTKFIATSSPCPTYGIAHLPILLVSDQWKENFFEHFVHVFDHTMLDLPKTNIGLEEGLTLNG